MNHSVPAKGRFVCEGACAQATHVRLFSCVNPLVPLQGIELGELLLTEFTGVRTLTCMYF